MLVPGGRGPKPAWLWWPHRRRPGRRGPVLAGVLAPSCWPGPGRPAHQTRPPPGTREAAAAHLHCGM